MLGKLYKQDMKATQRLFLPSYLIFTIVFILNKIMLEIGIASTSNNQVIKYIQIFCMVLYIIGIVGLFVLTYVFIVLHFYKTMSGEQGYLTHTLPVKTNTIIWSKLFNAVIWQVFTALLVFLSFCVLAIGHATLQDFQSLWDQMVSLFQEYPEIGNYVTWFTIDTVLVTLLSLFHSPLMFYASIAIGHLFLKHKVGGAVLAYIALYMVSQIIGTITLAVGGFFTSLLGNTLEFYRVYHNIMLFNLIFSVLLTVIYYYLTKFIFQKKLNLE